MHKSELGKPSEKATGYTAQSSRSDASVDIVPPADSLDSHRRRARVSTDSDCTGWESRKPVIRLQDIIKGSNTAMATMVRKQLSEISGKEKVDGEVDGDRGQDRERRGRKRDKLIKGASGTSSPSSASSGSGSKNIFEQFDLAARVGQRSPRKHGNSPRGKVPTGDREGSRSSSEERQSTVATAVRALRGISGKVKGKLRGHSETETPERGRSRNESPGSTSPRGHHSPRAHHSPRTLASNSPKRLNSNSPKRLNSNSPKRLNSNSPKRQHSQRAHQSVSPKGHRQFSPKLYSVSPKGSNSVLPKRMSGGSPKGSNSVSPKRMSPRRLSDKGSSTSPADDGLKALKKSHSAPVSERNRKDSPNQAHRTRSPREVPPVTPQEVNSPRSLRSGLDLSHPPLSEPAVKPDRVNTHNANSHSNAKVKTFPKGEKPPNHSTVGEKHAIQIMSSTGQSPKVIHVDTGVPVARQLFVNTETNTCSVDYPSLKQPKYCSTPKKGVSGRGKQDAATSPGAECDIKTPKEEAESLLCAMLVGGSEVTKSYEQSRDSHGVGSDSPKKPKRQHKTSESSSTALPASLDSLFDDDLSETPESKPYELPVLSRLPQLKNVNMSVLELTKMEGRYSEGDLPEIQRQKGHSKKQKPLLDLISRIKNCVSSEDNCCQEADEVLMDVSVEEEEKIDTAVSVNAETAASVNAENNTAGGSQQDCTVSQEISQSATGLAQNSDDVTKQLDTRNNNSVSAVGCAQAAASVSENSEKVSEACGAGDSVSVVGSAQAAASVSEDSEKLSGSGAGVIPIMEPECAQGSPSSLGELDPAQMTEAATQAVQNNISNDTDTKTLPPSVQNNISNDADTKTLPPSSSSAFSASTTSELAHTLCQESTSKTSVPFIGGNLPSTSGSPYPPTPLAANSWHVDSGAGPSSNKPRTFFSRVNSPSRTRWKPKSEPAAPVNRPKWSKWHELVEPQPLEVLEQVVHLDAPKGSAFASRELDSYLRRSDNRQLMPASQDSQLAKFLIGEGLVRGHQELERQLSGDSMRVKSFEEEGDTSAMKSEEEEDGEEDDKDLELARRLDPDFDEVAGLVFVSFPSEMGVKAHEKVEKDLLWERDQGSYINMAKFHAFEEARRKEGHVRRESQGLRGQHMKWRKYQRLYRIELRQLYRNNNKDVPWPLSKLPEKTNDIHKIKNWKKKYSADVTPEDLEAMELLGEEEERVKRKRRTYVFSTKRKKPKLASGVCGGGGGVMVKEEVEEFEEEGEETDDYGTPIPLDQDSYMDQVQNSIQEMQLKEKGLKQTKGIFVRLNMGPEERHIFKKLGGWVTRFRRFRKLPPGMKPAKPARQKPKARTTRPVFEMRTVSGFNALKALSTLQAPCKCEAYYMSKYVTNVELPSMESCVRPQTSVTGSGVTPGSNGTPGSNVTPGSSVASPPKLDLEASVPPASSSKVESGVQVKTNPDGTVVDLTDDTPENSPAKKCDKPGCRFGCICHLCLGSAEMETNENDHPMTPPPATHGCDKEYCRLGCICDSLEASGRSTAEVAKLRTIKPESKKKTTSDFNVGTPSTACTKPGCANKCVCHSAALKGKGGKQPCKESPKQKEDWQSDEGEEQGDSSEEECPTLEKTAPRRRNPASARFSNLPRRETSYRMAKNLDAVSRKAMMMWETSEVYSEQISVRRRKIQPDAPGATPTTSSPSITTSPTILSSTSVATATSQANSNMVSASVSVNTLPPTSSKPSQGLVDTGVQATTQNPQALSPVIVSDDEVKPPSQAVDTRHMSRRSLMKMKMFTRDAEDESPAAKMARLDLPFNSTVTPSTSINSVNTPTSTLSNSSKTPSTTTTHNNNASVPSRRYSADSGHAEYGSVNEWQTSLICLRANSKKDLTASNDDIMEEDEIKLFEFFINCNWERSKKDILRAITNTLKRGVYPEPCVMYVGDFRVEILPKAARPSVIPVELRTKLPKCMFSVRVQVTEPGAERVKKVLANPSLVPHTAGELLKAGAQAMNKVDASLKRGLGAVTTSTATTPTCASSLTPGVSTPQTGPGSLRLPSHRFPNITCASGMVGSVTTTQGSVGISGLGKLQISQRSQLAPPQGLQHFKILRKDSSDASNSVAGSEGEPRKKKKKKKKKKQSDVGDDTLVPSLSNLTVSPRKSESSATSTGTSAAALTVPTHSTSVHPALLPPVSVSLLPPIIGQPAAVARMPVVTNISPSLLAQPNLTTGQPVSPGVQPLARLAYPGAAGGVRLLPPNVKLLQMPGGQNNLVQILPASMLNIRPKPGAKQPDFYCMPVSMASLNQAQLLAAKKLAASGGSLLSVPGVSGGQNKSVCAPLNLSAKTTVRAPLNLTGKYALPTSVSVGDKASMSAPLNLSTTPLNLSKTASQASASPGHTSNTSVSDKPDGKTETGTEVKKKKKKKKKKKLTEGDSGASSATSSATTSSVDSTATTVPPPSTTSPSSLASTSSSLATSSNPGTSSAAPVILVASSPAPVMSYHLPSPIKLVKNTSMELNTGTVHTGCAVQNDTTGATHLPDGVANRHGGGVSVGDHSPTDIQAKDRAELVGSSGSSNETSAADMKHQQRSSRRKRDEKRVELAASVIRLADVLYAENPRPPQLSTADVVFKASNMIRLHSANGERYTKSLIEQQQQQAQLQSRLQQLKLKKMQEGHSAEKLDAALAQLPHQTADISTVCQTGGPSSSATNTQDPGYKNSGTPSHDPLPSQTFLHSNSASPMTVAPGGDELDGVAMTPSGDLNQVGSDDDEGILTINLAGDGGDDGDGDRAQEGAGKEACHGLVLTSVMSLQGQGADFQGTSSDQVNGGDQQ